MSYKTKEANKFYTEFYSYLVVHGEELSAGRWLKCESMIGVAAALLDDGRQTSEEAEDSIHFYLLLVGI